MLESSSDWPDRAWIERAVYNQYDRQTREKSEAGPKALASVCRVVPPPEICQFCSQAGHTAANCRKLEYAKREPKENDKRGRGQRRGGKADEGSAASANRGDKKLHRQRLGKAGIRRFRLQGGHHNSLFRDRTTRSPIWSASLSRIHRI